MEKTERKNDGALDSTFLVDGNEIDDGEGEGAAEPEAGTEPAAEPAAGQKVPLSRRAKARERDEAILSKISSLSDAQEKRDREYREHLEEIRRENAELRGTVHTLATRPAPEAQRREEAPDSAKLLREAQLALDSKDFGLYQQKTIEAAEARMLANPRFAQQPAAQQQAPQVNPLLMATAAQYGDVMGNSAAFEIAMAHDRILAAQRVPEGPDRWKRALDEGRRFIGGTKQTAPTFSQRNAAALSGIPTAGGGGGERAGSGEPGIVLTKEELDTAKKYKISPQDYARELAAIDPKRVSR